MKNSLSGLLRATNLRVVTHQELATLRDSAEGTGTNNVFSNILTGLTPDPWTSYITFELCRAWPVVAGPMSVSGRYASYLPETLLRSYRSVVNKPLNIMHQMVAYDVEKDPAKRKIKKDRIIGSTIAAYFPPPDLSDDLLSEPSYELTDAAHAPCIQVLACVFMAAEDAVRVLEEHVSGEQTWSVSIEVVPDYHDGAMDVGLCPTWMVPDGEDPRPYIYPVDALPSEVKALMSLDEKKGYQFKLGPGGKPIVCFYGAGKTPGARGMCQFQGVGMTPNPAEHSARVTMVDMATLASMDDARLQRHKSGLVALRASGSPLQDLPVLVQGKPGRVTRTWHSGEAYLPGANWCLRASAERPVCQVTLRQGLSVLRYLDEVM